MQPPVHLPQPPVHLPQPLVHLPQPPVHLPQPPVHLPQPPMHLPEPLSAFTPERSRGRNGSGKNPSLCDYGIALYGGYRNKGIDFSYRCSAKVCYSGYLTPSSRSFLMAMRLVVLLASIHLAINF